MVTAKGSGDVSFASNLTAILLGGFVKAIEVTNKVIPYVPQNRAWGTKSVHRTRSRRMKFCVQRGLGGIPQQAALGSRGYPGALLATFVRKQYPYPLHDDLLLLS